MYKITIKPRNDPNPGIFITDNNLTKFLTLTCLSVHPCNKQFSLQFKFHTQQSFPQRAPFCRLVWKARWWLPAGKNSSCRLREGNQRDTLTSNKRICEFLSFLRHSGTTQHSPLIPPKHHYHNAYTSSENQPTSLQQGYNAAHKTNSSLTGCPIAKRRAQCNEITAVLC